ncbi:hypothetical protein Zm00014a_025917 [Zea mays]|uniref:Uncharacterized protein n=1 Tax=Zea mays TaxID=4577 RepID=A0A3L6F319_MAIZE|nr:hypothetical protein Zm00014a_025917 [Zea mays]
MIKYIEIQKH